ncbi:hypothetical protein A2495_03240 [Candidatus Curtissbacteria bacterium RIFOXYC12_FULL_41_11]|nr:MAG: hypothetical protein A2495_03240 [Candidatus Curtissbacteria bacterium RIFOXYC12_FULL_41_11]
MRDLGQQNFGKLQHTSKNKIIFRAVVFLIIVGGVFYFARSRFSFSGESGSSIILREAPRGLTPVEIDGSIEDLEGVDLTTQQATFEDVKYNGQATATATRSFGGGTYILTVDATLPDPVNVSYQVWLVGGGKATPIDYMSGSKTSWSLNLRSLDKYSQYDGIWITLERTKDSLSEEHVMEGTF